MRLVCSSCWRLLSGSCPETLWIFIPNSEPDGTEHRYLSPWLDSFLCTYFHGVRGPINPGINYCQCSHASRPCYSGVSLRLCLGDNKLQTLRSHPRRSNQDLQCRSRVTDMPGKSEKPCSALIPHLSCTDQQHPGMSKNYQHVGVSLSIEENTH